MRSSIRQSIIVLTLSFCMLSSTVSAQIDCGWGLNVRVVGPDGKVLDSAKLELLGDRVPQRHLINGFVSWGNPMGTGPGGSYRLEVWAEGHKPFETMLMFPSCDMHYYEVRLQSEKNLKDSSIEMLSWLTLRAAPDDPELRPISRIELVDEEGSSKSFVLERNYLNEVIPAGAYELKGYTGEGDLVFTIPRFEITAGSVHVDFRFPYGVTIRGAKPVVTCNRLESRDRPMNCVVIP
ncbi:MAG: hypothetical protein J5I65_14135 [Aridibacter famidurans]|nr:hypothetical protein [Aridibacter famidurans]